MTTEPLSEKQILVAEDEFLLADDMCRDLQGAGAVVIGPVPSIKRALALIAAASVPFVFTSGYDDTVLKQRYPQVPRCQKPTSFPVVAQALAAVLAGSALPSDRP